MYQFFICLRMNLILFESYGIITLLEVINLGKLGEFFKKIKVTQEPTTSIDENKTTQEIQIQIEGDVGLFKDEKEKIIEGAKQLLEIGRAENMEDAIITVAVMLRGLKFKETKKTQDGKTVVVLKEIDQGRTNISKERD